eukprot:TRINITY_DN18548_c0_g2_i2.p1 TRINITY_DN18548_c0_g2~~TRINITY_DN18548_c0_g2_i2.p1  ORF type:complete len:215 (-),score=39.63 TRINITY_DN18548_c0_g2_i2:256-900(-)
MELRDYNPLMHERGLHPKLNWLVKESLQFGSVPPKRANQSCSKSKSPNLEPSNSKASTQQLSSTRQSSEEKEEHQSTTTTAAAEDDKAEDCIITEVWEQLIVDDVSLSYPISPTCISKPSRYDMSILSSDDNNNNNNKALDEKTTRILERLEPPRDQHWRKGSSPVLGGLTKYSCGPMKKPLVPFKQQHHSMDQGSSLSQPLKPNLQRHKRKLR